MVGLMFLGLSNGLISHFVFMFDRVQSVSKVVWGFWVFPKHRSPPSPTSPPPPLTSVPQAWARPCNQLDVVVPPMMLPLTILSS